MLYVGSVLFRETRKKRNRWREEELLETPSIFKLVRSRAEEERETALSEFVRLKIYPMRVVYQAAPVPPFHPQPRFRPTFSHVNLLYPPFPLVSFLYFQFSSSSLPPFPSRSSCPSFFSSFHRRQRSSIISRSHESKYFIIRFVVTGFEDPEKFSIDGIPRRNF